ncbi:hypothetical protein OEV98_14735 [Caldibacillus lycopersici]|uniref:Uncharacterized protein n=1 Tax=Perspicuibacillus lycopersici TaxID=1325689 RepID=A0AAE3IUQ7_9BACI|nr:hypothetical protein [Perspicuibacillus lycopersici]MCU9614797.1 hypothetical protein [Perspicuibacillus lycopersici]
MIGLIIAMILFNIIAFKTNKRLSWNQILHIWMFTIAFQMSFDMMIEFKYFAYWYFGKKIEWQGFLPHFFIVPPVNILFLNLYPFEKSFLRKCLNIIIWDVVLVIYEAITILPKPWGYFHYGWWKLWHAAVLDPILLIILLLYYRLVLYVEAKAINHKSNM